MHSAGFVARPQVKRLSSRKVQATAKTGRTKTKRALSARSPPIAVQTVRQKGKLQTATSHRETSSVGVDGPMPGKRTFAWPPGPGSVKAVTGDASGEGHAEAGSRAGLAFDLDPPPVQLADAPHDCEPQARAVRTAVAIEPVEDPRQGFLHDPASRIRHRQAAARKAKADAATLGMLHGIADQVGEHEPQCLVIDIQHRIVPDLRFDIDRLARNVGAVRLDRV